MEAFVVDDSVSEIVIFLFGPGVLNLAGQFRETKLLNWHRYFVFNGLYSKFIDGP
jgi:hypothetical protein